jgi:hypothetical protein
MGIMNRYAALHSFYASFGLKAYEENTIPSGDRAPEFPYLTYNVITDSFGHDVSLALSLWYRDTSLKAINAKTDEISAAIGAAGRFIPCDGGGIWLRRGSPFAQNMSDPEDEMIKRKYINLVAEYIIGD